MLRRGRQRKKAKSWRLVCFSVAQNMVWKINNIGREKHGGWRWRSASQNTCRKNARPGRHEQTKDGRADVLRTRYSFTAFRCTRGDALFPPPAAALFCISVLRSAASSRTAPHCCAARICRCTVVVIMTVALGGYRQRSAMDADRKCWRTDACFRLAQNAAKKQNSKKKKKKASNIAKSANAPYRISKQNGVLAEEERAAKTGLMLVLFLHGATRVRWGFWCCCLCACAYAGAAIITFYRRVAARFFVAKRRQTSAWTERMQNILTRTPASPLCTPHPPLHCTRLTLRISPRAHRALALQRCTPAAHQHRTPAAHRLHAPRMFLPLASSHAAPHAISRTAPLLAAPRRRAKTIGAAVSRSRIALSTGGGWSDARTTAWWRQASAGGGRRAAPSSRG